MVIRKDAKKWREERSSTSTSSSITYGSSIESSQDGNEASSSESSEHGLSLPKIRQMATPQPSFDQ